MTTHNSYRWSLIEQLEYGIRGFELDIHDTWTIFERIKRFFTLLKIYPGKGNFKVGHWAPGHEVNHKASGNPRSNKFEGWLKVIYNWSQQKPTHGPITIFLDIKRDLQDRNNRPHEKFGLIRFNEQISTVFKSKNKDGQRTKIYTKKEYLNQYGGPGSQWPTIRELRGRIILVLMSFHVFPNIIEDFIPLVDDFGISLMQTRQTYQIGEIEGKIINPLCFVAFNPDDRENEGYFPSMERDSMFVTAYYPEEFHSFWNKGKIIRTDYNPKEQWPPFPPYVNFPATNNWNDPNYKSATKDWVI